MSFRAVTFSKMGVKSEDHALIFDTVLNHTDGRIKGCDLTYDTNNLFIGTGFMIAQGRLLEIVGTHTVPVPAVQVGDQYVQIVFEIDLSKENTIQNFNQGDFKLVTSYDGWQPYVQEDLFSGGYVYQIPIARMMNNVDGIHSFEALLGSVVVSELWSQLEVENEEYRNQFDVFFTENKNIVLQMIADLEAQDFVTNTELLSVLQSRISNSNTVTEMGMALDATQANPNIENSLAHKIHSAVREVDWGTNDASACILTGFQSRNDWSNTPQSIGLLTTIHPNNTPTMVQEFVDLANGMFYTRTYGSTWTDWKRATQHNVEHFLWETGWTESTTYAGMFYQNKPFPGIKSGERPQGFIRDQNLPISDTTKELAANLEFIKAVSDNTIGIYMKGEPATGFYVDTYIG